MEVKQAAKFDEEMRKAGQSGAFDEKTADKILDMMKEWNEFLEEQKEEFLKEE